MTANPRLSLRFGVFVGTLVAFLAPSTLVAQDLHAEFVEAGSGKPVDGALVRLVGTDGETTRSLTDARGKARLRPASGGRYRVRVERIGIEGWTSETFMLRPDAVERRVFRVPVRAVQLDDLTVSVGQRECRVDPSTGDATARLWAEIRKALERERYTRVEGRVSYRVREYRRVLDGELRVVSEEANTLTTAARSPYRSVPVEELASGFVVREGTARVYRAPDADVLLSSAFQRTHCFRITRDEERGWLGLAFRPVEGRRVPEVRGVLWVNAETAALREVVYRYVNLDLPVADSLARGRVEFGRAPTGDWFVTRWWIRWPRRVREGGLEQQTVDARGVRQVGRDRRITSYGEVGAEVTSLVSGEEGEPDVTPVGRGTVTGTVYDSLSGGPAAGVEVRILGAPRKTSTDSTGWFTFREVPEGRYRVSFTHPLLPSLPDSLTGATVEVMPNLSVDARLAGPGPERLRAWACGEEPGGLVLGRVVAAEEGEPLPGATVRFRWRGGVDRGGPIGAAAEEAAHRVTVEADSTGRFFACGVPLDRRVTAGTRGDTRTLELTATRAFAALELRADPAAIRVERGEAREGATELRGTIVAGESGEPLDGALLRLLDAERRVIAEREGRFHAADLAPGRHRLVVEHLGYRTDTVAVALEEGTATFIRLTAETDPVKLPELEVTVEREVRDWQIRNFYRRKEAGLGRFASSEEVERHGVLGSLRRMPNVRIRPCYRAGLVIAGCYRLAKVARGGALSLNQQCSPTVFIDGMRVAGGSQGLPGEASTALDAVLSLPPEMIEGIEIHDPGTVPARYGGTGSACGIMLVWTKR